MWGRRIRETIRRSGQDPTSGRRLESAMGQTGLIGDPGLFAVIAVRRFDVGRPQFHWRPVFL